ncbi:MAG: hypothetical protein MJE66_07600 [Proteobacteria bacterium]|nr:hypothetical protein [Pseudomonadota bacterium]
MESLGLIAGMINLCVGVFVSVRILLVARRTKGVPEIFLGAYQTLIVLSGLGTGLIRVIGEDSPHAYTAAAGSSLMIAIGASALAFGVWRIYRPAERWPALLCSVLALWSLSGWAWMISGEALPFTFVPTTANAFFAAGRIIVYLWVAWESLRYYALLRRRLRMGLADPLVAHRIFLWGLFGGIMALTAFLFVALGFAMGREVSDWMPGQFLVFVLLLGSAWTLLFSFFPPAFYQRFIRSRAEGQGAAAEGA